MHITYSGIERRRSKRVLYPVEIWYRDRNKKSQGFKHGYGKNISQHGLLFETYENFSTCTILELKLGFPLLSGFSLRDAESFIVLGEVVRTEEIRRPWLYHIGVSFCKIEEKMREILGDYTVKTLAVSARSESVNSAPLR